MDSFFGPYASVKMDNFRRFLLVIVGVFIRRAYSINKKPRYQTFLCSRPFKWAVSLALCACLRNRFRYKVGNLGVHFFKNNKIEVFLSEKLHLQVKHFELNVF